LAGGYREWTDSRVDLLSDGRSREMTAAVRMVDDTGFGFWAASQDTFSASRERPCWWHKQANVRAALPKSACHGAGTPSGRPQRQRHRHRPRPPSRCSSSIMTPFIAKIVDDKQVLMECYRCPAAHCIHPPTINPVESTLATARPRAKLIEGPGLRNAEIAIVYQPSGATQTRGRVISAARPGAPAGAGEIFCSGTLLERPAGSTPAAPTASTQNGGRPTITSTGLLKISSNTAPIAPSSADTPTTSCCCSTNRRRPDAQCAVLVDARC